MDRDYLWIEDDITFCMDKCDNKNCPRHSDNIRFPELPHSYSMLKGTPFCPDYRKTEGS